MCRPSISARSCGLISKERDRFSDIGIQLSARAVDDVRDSFLIRKSIVVRFASQAPGNCGAISRSYISGIAVRRGIFVVLADS
jgi:hypothetical protein